MVEKIINNLNKEIIDRNIRGEYPTNYHYLLSEIFSTIGHWFDSFIEDDKYEDNNSLVIFIPSCFGQSATELFKGYEKDLITIDFISERYKYDLIDIYFSPRLKPNLLSEINDRCINIIPNEHIEHIFKHCLNERLALSYYDFKNKNFSQPTIRDFEQERLEILFNFLEKYNKI